MITADLEAKPSLLGYSEDWIAAGLLTEVELNRQLQEFSNGEDDNKEHYRYRTLTTYIRNQGTLSDNQVEQVVVLLRKDPDIAMASSALIGMLKMRTLTDRQFDLVKHAVAAFGNETTKYIEKQLAIRRKENSGD